MSEQTSQNIDDYLKELEAQVSAGVVEKPARKKAAKEPKKERPKEEVEEKETSVSDDSGAKEIAPESLEEKREKLAFEAARYFWASVESKANSPRWGIKSEWERVPREQQIEELARQTKMYLTGTTEERGWNLNPVLANQMVEMLKQGELAATIEPGKEQRPATKTISVAEAKGEKTVRIIPATEVKSEAIEPAEKKEYAKISLASEAKEDTTAVPGEKEEPAAPGPQEKTGETSKPTSDQEASPADVVDALKLEKTERDEFFKRLEKEVPEVQLIGKKEMKKIKEIDRELDDFVAAFKKETDGVERGSPKYIEICNTYIKEVEEWLDLKKIWSYKFSTERGGGINEELTQGPEDSLYYMTSSGVSLRLKRSIVAKEGLGNAIQPFYEKIKFERLPEDKISEEPVLGYFVREHTTQKFWDEVKKPETTDDFDSEIEKYNVDGKTYYITPKGVKVHLHDGDIVNQIFLTPETKKTKK